MSSAPFVMGKAETAFSRSAAIFDTTIGWRFVNKLLKAQYGVDSLPETAEHVAEQYKVTRADQNAFAMQRQTNTTAAQMATMFNRREERLAAQGSGSTCRHRRAQYD